jgi:hypothetical protein
MPVMAVCVVMAVSMIVGVIFAGGALVGCSIFLSFLKSSSGRIVQVAEVSHVNPIALKDAASVSLHDV